MIWFKRALADVKRGRNVDAYLAATAAFAFGVLGVLSVLDLRWTAPVLLLCLIPIINLLLGIHDRIPDSVGEQLKAETSWPAEPLAADWAANNDVLLVGVTLIRTVRSAETHIAERLRAGRTVRVLVVDPRNRPAMEMTDGRRRFGPADPEGNAHEVRNTLATLERIRSSSAQGNLELRTISFPIATGAIAFAPNQANARLYVSIYPFRTGETQPHFVLQRAHGHWFDHYSEELENMWAAGEPWTTSVVAPAPSPPEASGVATDTQ